MKCLRKFACFLLEKMNLKNLRLCGRLLTFFCCFGLGLLIFAQILLCGNWLSEQAWHKNWYGEVYKLRPAANANNDAEIWGNVVLELADYTELPEAFVLLNGEPVRNFTQKEVAVRVVRGDVISVDASAYEKAVRVRVKSVSSVIDPKTLHELTTLKQNSAVIGKVFLK